MEATEESFVTFASLQADVGKLGHLVLEQYHGLQIDLAALDATVESAMAHLQQLQVALKQGASTSGLGIFSTP